MRILITGSTGHVGGAIARHLGYAGHEVAGLSRHAAPTDSCDEHHAIDLAEPMAAEQVLDTVKGCDAIVHAAADLSKDLLSPTVPVTNGLGTVHMLRVARTWEVRAFVFISGVNVVGTPHEVPIREDHLPVPETSYHASKLYGEHLTRMAARAGTPASVLRLTAPVGPHMPSNRILPVFVTQALAGESIRLIGKGSRRQNYVDEADFARAVELSLGRAASGVFHIGGPASISNLDLAGLCIDTLGSSSTIEFLDRADPEEGFDWTIDPSRAAGELGYEARVPLRETIHAIATTFKR